MSYWLILGVVVSSSGCGALLALVVLLARIRKLSAGPETVGASGHTDCALGSPHNLVNRIVKSGLQLEPMSSLLNTELSLRCTFVAICSFLGPACCTSLLRVLSGVPSLPIYQHACRHVGRPSLSQKTLPFASNDFRAAVLARRLLVRWREGHERAKQLPESGWVRVRQVASERQEAGVAGLGTEAPTKTDSHERLPELPPLAARGDQRA